MARPPARPLKASRSTDRTDVIYGRRPVLELLRAGGSSERILMAEGLSRSSVLAEISKLASEAAVPLKVVPRSQVEHMARGQNHQGVVAVTGRYRYAALRDVLSTSDAAVLFLDGITDPHNVGSLLRSAECAGFTGVVLPAHRSPGVTAAVRRVSAGAAEIVPVARVSNLGRAIEEAKGAGLWILGLDEHSRDDIWSSELMERPVGFVLGAEDSGLSRGVRDHCDALVAIPQRGRIGSLNVAVAGAVAMFELARRGGPSDTL
jgi:23S rRNA (guanosine2251-2'-O)-methyltransferase